jgi:endonuclease III
VFFRAIQNIINKYGSDASRIWSGTPSSATVVLRFLSFRGAGPKIATMAANILVRDFKVPFSDHHSIDVSPDVHVRRVLTRTGHIPAQASHEQIIYKARELSPQFPGVIDLACWTIGRKHCHAQAPSCKECPVRAECVTAGGSACPSPHP